MRKLILFFAILLVFGTIQGYSQQRYVRECRIVRDRDGRTSERCVTKLYVPPTTEDRNRRKYRKKHGCTRGARLETTNL